MSRPGSTTRTQVIRVRDGKVHSRQKRDDLATEEPLEIRLCTAHEQQQLVITMRTPGADFDLAAGFLVTEGIVQQHDDIVSISYCVDRDLDEAQRYNVVNVRLRGDNLPDLQHLKRNFMMSAACGVCGKSSLDALSQRGIPAISSNMQISPEVIYSLPATMKQAQRLFHKTGGIHAAALFTKTGELLAVREDVGRHNALDKLIGWAFLQGMTALNDHILLVSGRASYELVQKALVMQIPVLCAISAPSSLAVNLAREFNMTLTGFLRDRDFNLYHDDKRIVL
ncbi:MAG: formate dehydrogenase accessory sulfurtransferase FdhD [Aggregatilineales bacterium]